LRLISAGVIQCTIDQQPYVQGYYPVVQLTLYCRYGIRPSDIDAGAGVVTKDDVPRIIGLSREHFR
jgi:simple sugar transport system substrate-binding protein